MWPGDNASAQVTCLGQRSQGCRAPLDCKAGHSGKTHNPTGWVMVFLKKKIAAATTNMNRASQHQLGLRAVNV